MTVINFRKASPAERADLQAKWRALRQATLAMKPYEGRPIHDPERAAAYAAYLRAMKSYEAALLD
jgi:hypothetical protein